MSLDPENYEATADAVLAILHTPRGGRVSHSHDHRVTVHEHRAPTDESVRLMREMEQAAKDRLLGTYEVPTTVGTAILHRFKSADMMGLGHQWYGRFNLNGTTFEITHIVKAIDTHHLAEGDRLQFEVNAVLRLVADEIARRLLHEGLTKIDPSQLRG